MAPDAAERILLVDDESYIREILSRWLEAEGYSCVKAANAEEALDCLARRQFSILLSDILMPGKSGMELLALARENYPEVAVIMVTGVDDRKQAVKALEMGAYGYIVKPFEETEVVISVANALERRRLTLAGKEYERYLEEEVRRRTQEIRRREEEIVLRLMWAVESRDRSTGAHARCIGLFSAALGEALGWDAEDARNLRLAAMMQDIGKIGIADGILLKGSDLRSDELECFKKHTEIGAEILQLSEIPLIQLAREIALCHHEKWDGSGYPKGLKGEAIPESARIVAVANAYGDLAAGPEALCSDQEIIAAIREMRGRSLDPRIFDQFLEMVPQFRAIVEETGEDKHV